MIGSEFEVAPLPPSPTIKLFEVMVSIYPTFENAEGHHWSYNIEHAVDVIWLEKTIHRKIHKFLVYDQERKMYRRYDTNLLLDTKEEHENFIKMCLAQKNI